MRGLQIVNGGQTTASLHRARRKDGVSLAGVEVPIKLIKVTPNGNLEDLVTSISRAANRQNTVQPADFSAGDPFHRELETLANNIWLESGRGRWFYERARGAYAAAEQKASLRATDQRSFREQTPKSRRLGKLDVARYLSSWEGFPWRVALGGQKNFQAFMQRRKDGGAPLPDEAWFRRLVATAILYRAAERIVRSMRFPAYGANIVAYLVAALGERAGGRIDFDLVWRRQALSPAFETLMAVWARDVDALLRDGVGSRNPTEWFKKEDCWTALRARLPALADPLPPELAVAQAAGSRTPGATGTLSAADYDQIESCMRVPPAHWFIAAGQGAGVLNHVNAAICATLATYASSGWNKRPSVKQARHGLVALAKCRDAGLLRERQD